MQQEQELIQDFRGDIIKPDDDGFDAAYQGWNAAFFDRKPKLVLIPEQASDVQRAVRWCNENNEDFIVMGGGHSFSGKSSKLGAVLIRLTKINYVHVDSKEKSAWIGMGARVADVDHETNVYNLCAVGGHVSDTGMGGFTLHGGFGCISRRYGLAADNILAARVILADGSYVEADPDTNSDLFWALQGAGSSVGIVVSVKVRLFPIANGNEVYAGEAFWLAESDEVFRSKLEALWTIVKDCPPHFSCMPLWANPPIPPFEGKRAFVIHTIWLGDERKEETETIMKDLLAPLYKDSPAIDMVGWHPYYKFNALQDALAPPKTKWRTTAFTVSEWGTLIDQIMELEKSRPPTTACGIEHWGGQILQAPNSDDILAGIRQNYLYAILGMVPDDALMAPTMAYVDLVKKRMKDIGVKKSQYVNYSEDPDEGVIMSTPHQRIKSIKAKYDPNLKLPALNAQHHHA